MHGSVTECPTTPCTSGKECTAAVDKRVEMRSELSTFSHNRFYFYISFPFFLSGSTVDYGNNYATLADLSIWNSACRTHCLNSWRSAYLYLPMMGSKVHHHTKLRMGFIKSPKKPEPLGSVLKTDPKQNQNQTKPIPEQGFLLMCG